MSNNWDTVTSHRSVTVAMIGFAAAFALHGVDHFRRGMSASPPSVMVGGTIQGLFVILAVVLVLRNHSWASRAAIIVGFGSAVLFVYAHVLPTFLPDFSRQLHVGTADQRHLVLLAHRRRRDRDGTDPRLCGPAGETRRGNRCAHPETSTNRLAAIRNASA